MGEILEFFCERQYAGLEKESLSTNSNFLIA